MGIKSLICNTFNRFILKESVDRKQIETALKNRFRVFINYEGDPEHGIAPGPRYVDPYCFMLTKAGNQAIRAFQPFGDTASSVPDWKLFRVDRITKWVETPFINKTPADGFNPNGDKGASKVIMIANYGKKTPQPKVKQVKITPQTPSTEPEIFKTDTEKGIENLRNQLNKPTYIDDYLKNKNQIPNTKITPNAEPVVNNEPNQQIDAEKKPEDVFKTDTERGIENLNRQVQNPTILKDFDKITRGWKSPFNKENAKSYEQPKPK